MPHDQGPYARGRSTVHVIGQVHKNMNGPLDDEVLSQSVVSEQLKKSDTDFLEALPLTEVTSLDHD